LNFPAGIGISWIERVVNRTASPGKGQGAEVEALNLEGLLRILVSSKKRMTPVDLEKALGALNGHERRSVREAVRTLVDCGTLQYTQVLGCTFLEPSIQGVRHAGNRIVLKPPERYYEAAPHEVVVNLLPGSAFGMGDHATTRLALRGIETAIRYAPGILKPNTRMLDLGTGNGVLMLAALLLGMGSAVGVDTDPGARYEAAENARMNGVRHRVTVRDVPLEDVEGTFALVAANLRWPTLRRMAPRMPSLVEAGGACVVSGLREEESKSFLETYAGLPFTAIWVQPEQGWGGALFLKR